jgi:hypothetical protein
VDTEEPQFWRVHCHIGHHPGQWQFWFREQCCAVGWHPTHWRALVSPEGRQLNGESVGDRDWATTRNALRRMRRGDWIAASLPEWRVGRIGRIVDLEVQDDEWNPIVRPSRSMPFGENGRRILVRWDLTIGPDDPSKVVFLPHGARWNPGQVRGTIRELPLEKLTEIKAAMKDDANWVSLAGAFSMEVALSDYISIHPGRLEAGMIAHPSGEVRERTFHDKSRADIILQGRNGGLVVAECKQNAPSLNDLEQVDGYRRRIHEERPELGPARALLVHGGASRVHPEIAKRARELEIELVYFELQVNFSGSRS